MIARRDQTTNAADLTLEERRLFLALPIEERRRRLAEQAEKMAKYYEQVSEQAERLEWQGGDIVEH